MVWMRRISARISSRSLASRLDSGSSISTSGGSTTMARAIATRCCWPPESWPGSLSRLRLQPHQRQRLDRPGARSPPSAGAASPGRSRHCAAPSCAGTARSSGTPCRSRGPPAPARRCAARRARSRRRSAAAGRRCSSAQWTCRSRDGPSRATNSPRSTVSDTSRSACNWPKSRLTGRAAARGSRARRSASGATCRPARRPAGPSAGTHRPACPAGSGTSDGTSAISLSIDRADAG